jgi:hypothetical protein
MVIETIWLIMQVEHFVYQIDNDYEQGNFQPFPDKYILHLFKTNSHNTSSRCKDTSTDNPILISGKKKL